MLVASYYGTVKAFSIYITHDVQMLLMLLPLCHAIIFAIYAALFFMPYMPCLLRYMPLILRQR